MNQSSGSAGAQAPYAARVRQIKTSRFNRRDGVMRDGAGAAAVAVPAAKFLTAPWIRAPHHPLHLSLILL